MMNEALNNYRYIWQRKELPFVEALYLYGSRARGDHRHKSDIDLAVVTAADSGSDWQQVLDIIEDADTLLNIDIVDYKKISNAELKANIDREKVAL
jgi:predicted nucleotidyltransferase